MRASIKFRLWNRKRTGFLKVGWVNCFCVTESGEILIFIDGGFRHPAASGIYEDENLVLQRSVGVVDSAGVEVFEGDIIKFKYRTGDFAWEIMTKEEVKACKKAEGKEFKGTVRWNDVSAGFEIVTKANDMIFPVMYAGDGKVIGNIFKNPKLIR